MILTEKMEYLSAIIFMKDSDVVTKSLLSLGVIEFSIDPQYTAHDGVRRYTSTDNFNKIHELRKRCGSFLEMGKIAYPDTQTLDVTVEFPSLDLKQVESFMNELTVKITTIREQQRYLSQRTNEWKIIQKRLVMSDEEKSSAIMAYRGTIPIVYASNLQQKLASYTSVINTINHINNLELEILFNKNDANDIIKILQRYRMEGLEELDLNNKDLRSRLTHKVEELLKDGVKEQKSKQEEVSGWLTENTERLQNYWLALRARELYNQIQSQFSTTSTTAVFSGWIPASQKNHVIAKLQEVTHDRIIIQSEAVSIATSTKSSDESLQPPTKLKNNAFSRPYELLVNTYGVAKYGQVDPTLTVSIFFTLMFGLMFADAGQGAIILLLGVYLLHRAKKSEQANALLQNAGKIVLYCGLSSIFFGIMVSSYFGLQPFPPIWFDLHGIAMTGRPHHTTASSVNSIGSIFALSFQFGFIVLGTGLLFNFINKIRSKQYFNLIFNANGLLGAVFYALSAHLIWHSVVHGYANYPYKTAVLSMLVLIAVAFLIIPIKHTIEMNKEQKSHLKWTQIATWPAIWLFDLYEMISGYFSSTLSFVRVGAIGIVHAVLMGVFYSLAQESGNVIVATLIVIFVNVLVIGLEGMLAAVNSMRLHFYEFFSRYFEVGGRLYQPVTLKSSVWR